MNFKNRRSIRLRDYDSSQVGAYFVTVCTQYRQRLFGDVVDGVMVLNAAGRMIESWYFELNNKFNAITCDVFVCMPDHVHFVIIINPPPVGAIPMWSPAFDKTLSPVSDKTLSPYVDRIKNHGDDMKNKGDHIGSPLRDIIAWFKTMTTNAYIRGVHHQNWPPFPGKLWQRNYYECIIRDDVALTRIRQYIANNPKRWTDDP
jgi:putative transposase